MNKKNNSRRMTISLPMIKRKLQTRSIEIKQPNKYSKETESVNFLI